MDKRLKHAWLLFILSLLLYSFTRFYSLENFPVYFFTDEAYHVLKAEELKSFSLYSEVAPLRFRPILSVYPYVITNLLFGKSVFTTRAVTAFFSILAAISLSVILKWIFKIRLWWTAPLILGVIPSWFIHSRTGFETAVMASFYAIFLLFYLLYRYKNPKFIFPSVIFAAFAFYTYSNGQLIILTLGAFLFLSDIRYHLKNFRLLLLGAIFTLILAWPFVSFQKTHGKELSLHLRVINSYLLQPIPLQGKIAKFTSNYLYSLSPNYWFHPTSPELDRHRMKGYGHINRELYPLILIGMGFCLWRIRQSKYRTVLFALLAAPIGGALAEIGITRVLSVVIPATLLAVLGLNVLLIVISRRLTRNLGMKVPQFIIFTILSFYSFNILRDSLTNGPLWFRNYGLYGMQWGAKEIFADTIPKYLAKDPKLKIMVSPVWANGTELFSRFFLNSEQQKLVLLRNYDYYSFDKRELTEDTLLIMPDNEYQKTVSNPKFKILKTESVIPYPDGTPGFYLLRLSYSDQADEIFRKEKDERKKPVEEELEVNGEKVKVTHSRLDIGPLKSLVDGDTFTLIRGMEANLFVMEFQFSKPKTIQSISLDLGSMSDFTVTVKLPQKSYSQTFRNLPPDPHVEIKFDQKESVSKLAVEIKNNLSGNSANIHIRELIF